MRDAASRAVLGLELVWLAVVALACAFIGVVGTRREHGFAVPAGIGVGAGLIAASAARFLGLPAILPIHLGALVCPAAWSIAGAALLVAILRIALRAGTK